MSAILLQSARTVLAIVLLYMALTLVALTAYPRPAVSGAADTSNAVNTVYETQAKYLIFHRSPLRAAGPRVILLGASNTAAGLPIDLLQAKTREAVVNNVAVNGSNLTEIAQAFDLAREALTPADRARTVYVVGLWYGLFVDDLVKWPRSANGGAETEIDTERYRYGLYWRSANGPVALVPDNRMGLAELALYPSIAFEKLVRAATRPVRERFLGAQPNRTDAERNAYIATLPLEREQAAFWTQSFAGTGISERQIAALESMISRARADNSVIVLLDLPIPAWHSAALPYDSQYTRAMRVFLDRHRSDLSTKYVSLRRLNKDSWFSDEVHPKPRIVPTWVEQAAGPINAAVHALVGSEAPQ